ncbi:MAG: aldehyde dehydrogenase [Rhodanobacter sp. SCN 68-63]|nr:MAG: aldehyde dehydrogenase [Rhodanobacter sp. SCN 68-63]
MIRRLLLGLLALIVLAVVGLFALAWRSAIEPIAPPQASRFAPDLVARGEVLAGAGYCATCHTAKGGRPYAGGYAMATPFGTLYSSNITPDPDTGIGRWSEAAFVRAMRKGVARDGSHLFPAFPYQHFNLVTDEDLHALYAFLMTRAPVKAATPAPDIPFPLNVRALQAGWKLLFFRDRAFAPDGSKGAEWDRGAYLAEGLSHCSACHSPRNKLGAEKMGDARYAGAVVDHWYAPALTPANPAPLAWTTAEIETYLRQGGTALHGVAAGSMSQVIHEGLARLPDSDIHAIAVYIADRMGGDAKGGGNQAALAQAMTRAAAPVHTDTDPGAHLYAAACASCHYNRGPMPAAVRPELGLNSALTSPDPSTLIQVILHGVGTDEGLPGLAMPAYAHALDDQEIAQLASWLRRTQTDQPPWTDLQSKVAALRTPNGGARGQH